jgi:hypothetical protein
MNSDAVIGCDAVDVGAEQLRLKTATGATRTIPWSDIRLAGMGSGIEGHIQIKGVTEKVAPFRATHDALWVAYADGSIAQVMIEKTNPRRDAILAAFERHLGGRWRPDDLTESDLMGTMMIPPKVQIPRTVVWIMVILAIVFFGSVAILFYIHGAKPTSP